VCPSVHDVLDHQHVAGLDLAAQILEYADLAARLGRVAVGGDLQEVHLHRQVELPHEVGDEDEGAPQKSHHHELVGAREVVRDLAGQRLDARGDGLRRDHLVDHVVTPAHGYPAALP
jgi:hypothetical protein